MLLGRSPRLSVTALTHRAGAQPSHTASPAPQRARIARPTLKRDGRKKGVEQNQWLPVALGGEEPRLPCGSGSGGLLPVGRVGGLGAVSGGCGVGSLGGGNRGGVGVVGGRAVALDRLAVRRGGGRGGVTYNRPHQIQFGELSMLSFHIIERLEMVYQPAGTAPVLPLQKYRG